MLAKVLESWKSWVETNKDILQGFYCQAWIPFFLSNLFLTSGFCEITTVVWGYMVRLIGVRCRMPLRTMKVVPLKPSTHSL